MYATIRAIEYHLPERAVTNQELAETFRDWSAAKIADKTGIETRHLAAPDECASDLAYAAARKLFATGACTPEAIDFILFCTQSPDYIMPTSACLLQDRLGVPTRAGALDFNLGCSGYVYGLSLAKGLIETGQASNVLLLTADTLTKYIHPDDRGTRSLLGDAGAATLIQASRDDTPANPPGIGPFVFGTDGQGRDHLIVPDRAARQRPADQTAPPRGCFFMNGAEVFTFTLDVVPQAADEVLARAEITFDAVDLFVFHQANGYMLEHLREKLKIPAEKFVLALRHCGNTSSSTIPIALKEADLRGQLRPGVRVMLMAFGVGLSWGATLIHWPS